MNLQEIFEHRTLRPFAKFGFIDEHWGINIDTLCYTWIAMLCLGIFTLLTRHFIKKYHDSKFFTLGKIGLEYFQQSIVENMGSVDNSILEFIVGIFLFTLFCNVIGIIPGVEEATADINTTLAIGLSCFLYAQYQGIRYKGWGYFKKYFSPVFILFPLNLIGQVAKVASLSFRLFGNILAGTIILLLIKAVIFKCKYVYFGLIFSALIYLALNKKYNFDITYPKLTNLKTYLMVFINVIPIIQLLFGILEGVVQAGVLALITNMYIAAECSKNGGH